MRGELPTGIAAIWIGIVYLLGVLLLGPYELTTAVLTELAFGILFIGTGLWVLRDMERGETRGSEGGLPNLLWYVIAVALVLVALARTVELVAAL